MVQFELFQASAQVLVLEVHTKSVYRLLGILPSQFITRLHRHNWITVRVDENMRIRRSAMYDGEAMIPLNREVSLEK